jgi:copper homeostasis protein
MSTKSKIEICANSVESAVKAQEGGAYRVELCAGIPEGGTTPSFGEMRMARQLLQETKLHVIIRPRGGDFLYSQLEQEIMLHDIKVAKQLGADGVVFGCLTAEGNVDIPAMKKLMNAVGDMAVTFHRAFDMCRNPQEALEDIINLGCTRILTSGLEPNAVKGIPMLKELVQQADGRIIIMPGCGVNPDNIMQIAEETGATEFHFSGRSSYESGMIYRNPKVSMGGTVKIEEYQKDVTDPEIVKAAVAELAKKDEKDELLEKKNKELRSKSKKKKDDFDDDDDLD